MFPRFSSRSILSQPRSEENLQPVAPYFSFSSSSHGKKREGEREREREREGHNNKKRERGRPGTKKLLAASKFSLRNSDAFFLLLLPLFFLARTGPRHSATSDKSRGREAPKKSRSYVSQLFVPDCFPPPPRNAFFPRN